MLNKQIEIQKNDKPLEYGITHESFIKSFDNMVCFVSKYLNILMNAIKLIKTHS